MERLQGENSKEFAYRVLKNKIMNLELEPGQGISETELSDLLEISRTPIREVLFKLKEENLIEVKPQIGTYISLIDHNLIQQAIFMRYNLEKEAIKLSLLNDFNEDILIELKKNLLEQEIIKGRKEMGVRFHELDKQFHYLIFKAVNLKEVWEGIVRISTHYNRARLLCEITTSDEIVYHEHVELFNIIKNKELDKVEEIVFRHVVVAQENWYSDLLKNEECKRYFRV